MVEVRLGPLAGLQSARYILHLSNKRNLVLFRLPKIEPSQAISKANETSDGFVYYAMEAECPHAGGPMAEAEVDIEDSTYVMSCPWHQYDFNAETGESKYGISACTFPISIRDGQVLLHLSSKGSFETAPSVTIEPVSEKVKFKHGPDQTQIPSTPANMGEDSPLSDWCCHILDTSNPEHKIKLTTRLFSKFALRERSQSPMEIYCGTTRPPDEPPREAGLVVKPGAMPYAGKGGSLKSRMSMLHALANIEQWAIDLAVDICVRFCDFETISSCSKNSVPLPRTFFYDWLKVANDEAKHFSLLRARLEEMGCEFGSLPVHHGLWESAIQTKDDLRARISVIALVHEARGLDVNPRTIEKFRRAQDFDSVEILSIIHSDEITHVTTGHRWLSWICSQEDTNPVQVFRENVQKYFRGAVKGPFNEEARQQAGMDKGYYENLQGGEQPRNAQIIAGG